MVVPDTISIMQIIDNICLGICLRILPSSASPTCACFITSRHAMWLTSCKLFSPPWIPWRWNWVCFVQRYVFTADSQMEVSRYVREERMREGQRYKCGGEEQNKGPSTSTQFPSICSFLMGSPGHLLNPSPLLCPRQDPIAPHTNSHPTYAGSISRNEKK